MKYIELLNDDGTLRNSETGKLKSMADMDGDWDISALGTCGALDKKSDSCFMLLTEGIGLGADMALPESMDQIEVLLQNTFTTLMETSADMINVALRMKEAAASLIGLMPITLAILPGLAKGAKKTKYIVPQSTLVGFVLLGVPFLQLPLMATIMCVLIQMAGSWKIWAGIILFMVASMMPLLGLRNGLGPHRDRFVYNRSRKWYCFGKAVPQAVLQGPLMIIALVLIIYQMQEEMAGQTLSIDVDELAGAFTSKVLTVVKAVFNFFKGKTFTVIMSADLLLQMMIFMEKFTLTQAKLMSKYRKRMVGGLLLTVDDSELEYIKKFDEDGDGNFNEQEISSMMNHVFRHEIDRMAVVEKAEDDYIEKMAAKKAKVSKTAVAPIN